MVGLTINNVYKIMTKFNKLYDIINDTIEAKYINSQIILELEVEVVIYNNTTNEYLHELFFNHIFNTHIYDIKELKGEKFVWNNVYNAKGKSETRT